MTTIEVTEPVSADFEAGMAVVVAAQAEEEAAASAAVAELAVAEASEAASEARLAATEVVAATGVALELSDRVDALESRVEEVVDAMAEMSASIVVAETTAVEALDEATGGDGSPPPRAEETPAEATSEPAKTERKRRPPQTRVNAFSGSPWFRGRK